MKRISRSCFSPHSLFGEGISGARYSEQDSTQRAFDLAQAVTDQVRRRLKGGFASMIRQASL